MYCFKDALTDQLKSYQINQIIINMHEEGTIKWNIIYVLRFSNVNVIYKRKNKQAYPPKKKNKHPPNKNNPHPHPRKKN